MPLPMCLLPPYFSATFSISVLLFPCFQISIITKPTSISRSLKLKQQQCTLIIGIGLCGGTYQPGRGQLQPQQEHRVCTIKFFIYIFLKVVYKI